MFLFREKTKMIDPERAAAGRPEAMPVPESHFVLGTPLKGPFPIWSRRCGMTTIRSGPRR